MSFCKKNFDMESKVLHEGGVFGLLCPFYGGNLVTLTLVKKENKNVVNMEQQKLRCKISVVFSKEANRRISSSAISKNLNCNRSFSNPGTESSSENRKRRMNFYAMLTRGEGN